MAAKEKVIVKMVDASACEIISTETFKAIERDEIVHALKAVRMCRRHSTI